MTVLSHLSAKPNFPNNGTLKACPPAFSLSGPQHYPAIIPALSPILIPLKFVTDGKWFWVKRAGESAAVFAIGCVGYGAIEVLWRGYTHWTMVLTGGTCFSILYAVNGKHPAMPLWKKCLVGDAVITGIEFCVGCVVNRWLHWNVWDYSQLAGNFLGQICPLYSFLWYLLSAPIAWLAAGLRRKIKGQQGLLQPLRRLLHP